MPRSIITAFPKIHILSYKNQETPPQTREAIALHFESEKQAIIGEDITNFRHGIC